MAPIENDTSIDGGKKIVAVALMCAICVAVNFIGSEVAGLLGLPLYLDCIGIVLASAFGGYIPGIVVGYVTNFVTSLNDPSSFYYCLTSVLIAIYAAYAAKRGWFGKPLGILASFAMLVIIGGGIGSVITWCLYGAGDGSPATLQAFMLMLGQNMAVDAVDKAITLGISVAIIAALPDYLRGLLDLTIWQQEPLEGEQLQAARRAPTRGFSLRTKIVTIMAVVMVIVAVVTTGISYMMFHRSALSANINTGKGIVELVAEVIDADRVQVYLKDGEAAQGYITTDHELASIRDSFPEVQYVYVYKIMPDGCHVVFDPDTADEPGSEPGDIVPFDEAFMPYLDDLLAGNPIDPIVSNESYGWLLTVYKPIYDDTGYCVAYAAVDISMQSMVESEFAFLARVIILFLAFFILICAITIWLAEYGLIMPVNSIARATASFAFDSESSREEGVDHLRKLKIRTGDEVENLYHAVTKTSEDTVQFIADAQEKAATIERMQDNLIMVMADLVESRDKFTGDHVRKTAAYTDVIMRQMRKEGMFPDVLTDEFVSNVVKSAPLHDIGKIHVSDSILNKPGRLTDEEYDIMKGHTVAGKEILEDAVGAMSDPGYLDEARRLAAYHHEKWNGTGYPYGLAGEDIPLSARIMAVADVFDALVSKRSYKDGMPIEKALQIIRDDAGTHFDPQVAQAFLNAEDEVRRIAEQHGDASGTAGDIRDD